jgi:DNA polymerase III epsilon subunit-like protein
MVVVLDGETIVDLQPVMGYLHRSHEKIGERNTFIMNMPYTDRLDYFCSMSNPGAEAVENTDEARLVNGITKEEIAAAPPEDEVRAKFTEFITKYEGATLTAYNVHYDRIVLETNGWLPKDWRWGECIMMMATEVLGREGLVPFMQWKQEYKWASLSQAMDYFGVKHNTAHRALDDAMAAAEVWMKMTANERGQMIPLEERGK